MMIYAMTATFGKLEHETLTLEPGLNIIQAENEWGKSTWCAFLAAMFYGMDSRAKTTKTALAEKERYAPWSGSPMSGRIDLRWGGKDITIERTTKGRVPMGEFRAYETATGLAVPELTGANCGELLLGVEQSVFRRSAFIRLTDMPVTQDEALRRRLNALVTTGDENGDAERLEQGLRELKNKCRYNRTGLIPQAEAEREALESKLRDLGELERQVEKLKARRQEVEQWLASLENHQNSLQYTEFQEDNQRISQAKEDYLQAEATEIRCREACSKLPNREEAERKIHELREFQEQWHALHLEAELLPDMPASPKGMKPFADMQPEAARTMVQGDICRYQQLRRPGGRVLLVVAAFCLLLGIGAAVWLEALYLAAGAAGAIVFLSLGLASCTRCRRERTRLEGKYGSQDPESWEQLVSDYAAARENYERAMEDYHAARGDVDARLAAMTTKRQSLCGGQSPDKVLALWQQVLRRWEDYHSARRECQRARSHWEALQAMAKTCQPPALEDTLTYTAQETARLLSDGLVEQQRLQNRAGQCQGRMEALGQRSLLEGQLRKTEQRIQKLEQIYGAAELGLATLAQTKRELQRRFAPRISKRAQELLGEMTGGRYERLTFGEDFRIRAGAGEEDVLRDLNWRSDGTMDQLYLALRLAVAEELMPQGPLVLDDALVRFDDRRLKAAVNVLSRMSRSRQVVLFTCQSREQMFYKLQQEGE